MNLFGNPADVDVEQATSESIQIGTVDFVKNLDITDKIKAQKYTSRQVLQSIKKRLSHSNPNVILLSLSLLDTCVKNCGLGFQQELCQKEYVDLIASLVTLEKLKPKVLELIQFWALSFKSLQNSSLWYMVTIYEQLQMIHKFPKAIVNTVLLETTMAPPWSDSDICTRCRVTFTTFVRKHHCRNCGDTFCQECSSKTMELPLLGITDLVRVCDSCAFKLENKVSTKLDRKQENEPVDEDLERAIQASLREEPKPKPVSKEDADLERAIRESLRLDHELKEKTRVENTVKPIVKKQINTVAKKNILTSTQLENIHLFCELMQQTEQLVQTQGIQALSPLSIQTMFAQSSPLLVLLRDQIHESATVYKELYDMNTEINQVIHEYDQYVLKRFQFQQQRMGIPQSFGYNPNVNQASITDGYTQGPTTRFQQHTTVPTNGYQQGMDPSFQQPPTVPTNGYQFQPTSFPPNSTHVQAYPSPIGNTVNQQHPYPTSQLNHSVPFDQPSQPPQMGYSQPNQYGQPLVQNTPQQKPEPVLEGNLIDL